MTLPTLTDTWFSACSSCAKTCTEKACDVPRRKRFFLGVFVERRAAHSSKRAALLRKACLHQKNAGEKAQVGPRVSATLRCEWNERRVFRQQGPGRRGEG